MSAPYECCENQRIVVEESFTYHCEFLEDGTLWIDTKDYWTTGFENMQCLNCDKEVPSDLEVDY